MLHLDLAAASRLLLGLARLLFRARAHILDVLFRCLAFCLLLLLLPLPCLLLVPLRQLGLGQPFELARAMSPDDLVDTEEFIPDRHPEGILRRHRMAEQAI